MNIKEDEIETGSICTNCQEGKVALMLADVGGANMDDEPYTNGVREGDNRYCELEDYITITLRACDTCGYVFSSKIE